MQTRYLINNFAFISKPLKERLVYDLYKVMCTNKYPELEQVHKTGSETIGVTDSYKYIGVWMNIM